MRLSRASAIVASGFLLAGCGGEGRPHPQIDVSGTDLGTFGGWGDSAAHAINDRGQIVGYASTPRSHAVLWDHGRMRDLGTGGGQDAEANDINNRGQIVGSTWSVEPLYRQARNHHAFLWENGVMRTLRGPALDLRGKPVPEVVSVANAINDRGQVVGMWNGRAALWDDGHWTVLPVPAVATGGGEAMGINVQGDIVGWVRVGARDRALLWRGGKVQFLPVPRARDSQAWSVNDAGDAVGFADVAVTSCDQDSDKSLDGIDRHAVLWRHGAMIDLGDLGGGSSEGDTVNNQRQVLGQSPTNRAFRDCFSLVSDQRSDRYDPGGEKLH